MSLVVALAYGDAGLIASDTRACGLTATGELIEVREDFRKIRRVPGGWAAGTGHIPVVEPGLELLSSMSPWDSETAAALLGAIAMEATGGAYSQQGPFRSLFLVVRETGEGMTRYQIEPGGSVESQRTLRTPTRVEYSIRHTLPPRAGTLAGAIPDTEGQALYAPLLDAVKREGQISPELLREVAAFFVRVRESGLTDRVGPTIQFGMLMPTDTAARVSFFLEVDAAWAARELTLEDVGHLAMECEAYSR